MAYLTITVAGVDRTEYLCAPGAGEAATFEEALRERKTFTCEFLAREGLWSPLRGQGITVTHSTEGVIFGGYITNPVRHVASHRGSTGAIVNRCTCVSYEQVMSRRLSIARTWTGQVAGGIFFEIVDESLTDEGFTCEMDTGPTIPLFSVQEPRPTVRDALDRLCELASTSTDTYYWDVSPAKVARFFRQDTYPAPFDITDANPYVLELPSASVDETNLGIANRVFVYLGQFLLEEAVETFPGDSSATTFELLKPCGETPTITIDIGAGPVAQTVGIAGSDTGMDWYWALGSNQIQQDAGGTVLDPADELSVTYRGLDRRTVGPFEDAAAVAVESALQGDGTGLYETSLQLESVGTSTDAETLAQTWLERNKRATMTFRGATYVAGLRSGQEITVNLTTLGINAVFLIQSVVMTDAGAGRFLWTFTAIFGAARDDWKRALLGQTASTSISGSGAGGTGPPGPDGEPGAPAVAPNNFTIGTLSYRWVTFGAGVIAEVLIPVTPPSPIGTAEGGHIYVELEDQSISPTFRIGTSTLNGGDGAIGAWDIRDLVKIPYVATEQPWVIQLPDISPRRTTVVRVYVEPYSANVDAAPIRDGETDETPNAAVTITPYTSGKPSSGVSVTTALVTSVVATVSDPVVVSGRLLRPISVTVVLPVDPPDNWAYQLIGYVNGDLASSPVLGSGFLSQDVPTDPVPAGDDGITTPHTFGNEEPAELQNIVIYAVAGLIMPKPVPRGQTPGPAVFVPNNIVVGITASDDVSIGTTTGVIDPTEVIQANLNTTMAVLGDLFGVAPLGISNPFVAALAIATTNVQDAAIALAKLNDLSVSTAKLIDSATTGPKIAAQAVTTAKIDNLAVTTALIDNLAITTGKVTTFAITTALIANAAVTFAQIGSLAVGTAHIGDLQVSTAKIADLAVTDAKIGTLSVGKLIAGSMLSTGPTAGITITMAGSNSKALLYPRLLQIVGDSNSAVAYLNEVGVGGGGQLGVKDNSGLNPVELYSNPGSKGLFIDALRIVTARQSSVTAPSGGAVVDTESRTAINAIINRLQAHGLIS